MEEKKILGMPRNVCLGLSWLTLVLGIVALAVEHEKLEKEEKRQLVSVFVGYGFAITAWIIISIVQAIITSAVGPELGWIFSIIGFLVWCVLLVCMIFAFVKDDFKAPVFYNIAGNFVKDGEEPKEAKVEEPKEEKAEENKEE